MRDPYLLYNISRWTGPYLKSGNFFLDFLVPEDKGVITSWSFGWGVRRKEGVWEERAEREEVLEWSLLLPLSPAPPSVGTGRDRLSGVPSSEFCTSPSYKREKDYLHTPQTNKLHW